MGEIEHEKFYFLIHVLYSSSFTCDFNCFIRNLYKDSLQLHISFLSVVLCL